MNAAMLLGLLLGGVVFERSGYYAVFTMAFSLIFLDIVFRLVLVEKIEAEWFYVTVTKERYWIKVYDAAGTPRIAPSPKMKSISSLGFLGIIKTCISDTSITDYQDISAPRNTYFCNLSSMITLLRSARLLAAL
jgi:hypothetical protein